MYSSPLLKRQAAIVHGFSDVSDGNMDLRFGDPKATLTARTKFLGTLGLSPDHCVQQFGMGDKIHIVTATDAGRGLHDLDSRIEASVFITNQKNLGLFVCVADCLPIIIFDPVKIVIALVHASRSATNLLVPTKTIDRLKSEFNCRPADLLAALGPAVRAESYLYDQNIHKLVTPAWGPYLHELSPNQIQVDNVGYARDQLLSAGLLPANIDDSNIDTGSNPHYFSHVNATRHHQPEGRMSAAIALV